jgi:hypothetical protein
MANTQRAQLSYSFLDELGTRAAARFPAMLDPAMTLAQLVTATAGLGTLLDAITDGQIISARATVELGVQGAKEAPGADSRVEETAVFDFANAVTPYAFGVAVPSFLDTKLDGNHIDLADADVAAFTAAVIATITGGGVFTNFSQQHLTAVRDAFLSFRKHRKQLARTSYTTP